MTAVVVTGLGVVPFTNYLKSWFNLEDNGAKWLSIGVAVVLGVAEAIVANQITPDMFTLEGIAALVGLIWFVSQNFFEKHYKS